MPSDWLHPEIYDVVERALAEDIGSGDITTELTVGRERLARGKFYARDEMVLAGIELLPLIYECRGGVSRLELKVKSGTRCTDGDCIAEVEGLAATLLECERTALNFMQRLSGIATLASKFAAEVAHTSCKVLDTRKTTPGLRRLEKLASAAGGVTNHRMGLFDAILIKNNHIAAAGGVRQALAASLPSGLPVEIEVRTRAELDDALAGGAPKLLLDNLTPAEAREWVDYVAGRASCEISGGVTLETVRAYAESGADFVSSGAITHSAISKDLNFRLELL
ncbi:carboxylating nicotinate-nucleotide diphosphorylase [Bryobacter aggregatus]|uniref:carboxylating nicotinate-nucleotide diphosphorylase n=1 Tax=Bryobacter aggregatus TaxID=360054 RepID=UPI00068C45A4|nr:carboxylating nicotinate-nucleotide diphosphorylase [Bryobacter aggregatus]